MNFESRLEVCALQIRTLIWSLLGNPLTKDRGVNSTRGNSSTEDLRVNPIRGNQCQSHRQIYLDSLITEMETLIDEMIRTTNNETIDEDSIKEKLIIKKLFPIYWGLKDLSIDELAN